jgi:quinol monooxygenase YgiN
MASHLPLRSFRNMPSFLRATGAIRKQLATTDGLIGYSLDAKPLAKQFFTLSAWTDRDALDAFSQTDPHREWVTKIRPHMEPTTFVFWDLPFAGLPIAWTDAHARIDQERG